MIRRMRRSVEWITLAVFLASTATGVVADRWYAATQRKAEHEHVRAVILPYANSAAASVGRHVAQMAGLKAFVESRRDATELERDFAQFSAGLISNAPGIEAVQLVRDGRVSHVHPLRGNEDALGLDLRGNANPTVRADYQRAVTTDGVTIMGPNRLVQGGEALVIDERLHADYDKQLNIVAMLLDMPALLQSVGFQKAPPDLALRLQGKNGQLLVQTGAVLPVDPESVTVEVRDGNWALLGGPAAGWDAAVAGRVLPVRLAMVAIVLLLTGLASLLADRDARLKRAVEQRTASIMELVEERSETIRQQKKTEESLAANEERLRLALAAARMGTFEIDVPNGKLSGSSGLREMHGLPVGSKFRSLADVMAVLSEPDRETMQREFARGLREPATGAMEYRVVGQDGDVRWIGVTWLSRADALGVVQRIVGTLTNITARKNLEEQFLHAQKMQAVGALAGGIAHDFNNLLTVILGAGQMARAAAETLPGTGNVRADIDDVLAAGERAAVLTGQLLAFSRRQVIQPRLFDVGELVGNLTSMLNRLVGEQVRIETVLPGTPMSVFADQGQLTQVLMNLAVNARDAMPEGGRLQIEVHSTSIEEGTPPPAEGLTPGHYAVLSVTDTGEGIDPAIQDLVFDPFFTTKPVGQGTGLGLSTVYGIVVQLGGAVRLSSEKGRGTTVDVFVPLADRAATVAEARDTDALPPPGGAGLTLLVAEDEPGLQRLVARVLSKAGYRVLMAGDGAEALRAAYEHEGDIALLLSDVIMPNMGGVELASELRRERPGIRVLFVSGYPQDVERSGPITLTDASFLAKPFTPGELLDAVQRALDQPQGAGR